MKDPNNGPFYAAGLYPKLAKVFRDHGYALAVHGSVANDFDLVAVPWVDEAGNPDDVILECLQRFAFVGPPSQVEFEPKPHGRIAYKLHLSFGNCSLDISFTPRTGEWAARRAAPRTPHGTDDKGPIYFEDLDADALRDGKIKRKETGAT